MDGLGAAIEDQPASAREAKNTENLSLARSKQGAVGYLDVVVAQTFSLQAQRSVLDLQPQQLAASVELIRAVGGDGVPTSSVCGLKAKAAVCSIRLHFWGIFVFDIQSLTLPSKRGGS